MNDGKQTLSELVVGTIVWACLFAIGGVLLTSNKLSYLLGMLLGTVVAVIMAISMYRSLEKSIDMESGAAVGYTNRKVLYRVLLLIAAVAVSILASKYISFYGVIIGILCLKLSAYVQPLTHKLLRNK